MKIKIKCFFPKGTKVFSGLFFKAHGRSGHSLGASAGPRSSDEKPTVSLFSAFDGGQYDTKYMTLE